MKAKKYIQPENKPQTVNEPTVAYNAATTLDSMKIMETHEELRQSILDAIEEDMRDETIPHEEFKKLLL